LKLDRRSSWINRDVEGLMKQDCCGACRRAGVLLARDLSAGGGEAPDNRRHGIDPASWFGDLDGAI
jgi:hypothetical protein